MKLSRAPLTLSILAAATITLTACGGGGGGTSATTTSSTSTTPTTPVVTTNSITTTVMDGLISNALVCVDTNSNNLCDTSEVQGRTDASGKVTLNVAATDVATVKLIAIVGTDAVDADTGAVKSAYTLLAPAGKTAVISPLTTMVQAKIDADKVTTAVAEAFVTAQTGLTVSVYNNFIALRSQSAGDNKAGQIAYMVALGLQQATQASTSTAASTCTSNSARTAVLGLLSDLGKASSATTVAQACSSGQINTLCSNAIKAVIASLSCPANSSTPVVTPPVVIPPVVIPPVVIPPTTSATAGKALYAANCAICHGSNAAQNINNVLLGANSSTTILNAISANRGGMSFLSGTIGATQAANLAAFLATPGI